MTDRLDGVGYVRKLWAWDFETPWGQTRGFFVSFQSHRDPDDITLWLVDNARLESILAVAYAAGQLVSISSHSQAKSIGPEDLDAKVEPALRLFPLIDVVALPPHPGEPA